ncbi:MAG: glutamate--tRNA ligase [Patescibacteria group bacterium]|nr:glutamate--tRNA ligase [Patescibacteria group bacterium]
MPTESTRVRFAPSPTGPLHIGSARTALFNWIFARATGGKFILRIEDTDFERSKEEYVKDITEGLSWLGLEWDKFYKQSERIEIYRKHLERLVQEDKAYPCFCTKEELEGERQAMLSQGLAPKYSGKCRGIPKDEAKHRIEAGEGYVIRFKTPEIEVSFKDLVRGTLRFDASLIGDFVIARDFNQPLYQFAVVVDDLDMKITHVIRGDDHISNTPKQILIAKAFGAEQLPYFAHIPMILNPDRSKMSKRFADTSLKEYIDKGYLSQAVVNFLALLGWHPQDDQEVMTVDEIIKKFDISRVQKGGAVFDSDKLNWFNSHYIAHLPTEEILRAAAGFVPENWKINAPMLESVRTRLSNLGKLREALEFYFALPDYEKELLRWKEMDDRRVWNGLESSLRLIEEIPAGLFKKDALEAKLTFAVEEKGKGEILWPLRVALSGKKNSPGPFEIMEALGKEETMRRVRLAMDKVQKQP